MAQQKQLSVVVQAVDRLTAQTRQMAAQIATFADRTQREGRKAETAFSRIGGAIRTAQSLLAGFLTIYSARRILGSFAEAAREIDEVGKAARRLGLEAQRVGELKYAADLANISFGQLVEWIQAGQIRMAQFVRTGGGPAADALRRLNVPLVDARGNLRSIDALLPEILDSLHGIRDPAERLRRTTELFGRSAAPLLTLTSQGLREAADEARRLNIAFSPEQVRAAEKFNDALSRVRMSWLGLRADVVRRAGPELAEGLDKLASFIAAVPEMAANFALTFRLMLRGNRNAEREFQQWFESLGGLAAAGTRGVLRVGFEVARTGIRAILGMADAETESWFERLIVKAPTWLSTAYNAAWKGLLREFGQDTTLFEQRLEVLRGMREEIDRQSRDPFGHRLSEVTHEIIELQERLEQLSRMPQGQGWLAAAQARQRKAIEDQIEALRAERDRLRGLLRAMGTDAFEQLTKKLGSDGVAGALRLTREEVGAAAAQFLGSTDDILRYSEALARTSINGLGAAAAIQQLKGDVADTGEEHTALGGIRHELKILDKQATNTYENARRLTSGTVDALTGGLGPAILDTAADASRAGEIWREALGGILRQVSELITRMLLLRAISSIGNALFARADIGPLAGAGVTGGLDASFVSQGLSIVGPNRGGVIGRDGDLHHFALGGIVPGPQVNRDMVLGLLTPGEGVLNREAVARIGAHKVHQLNRGGDLGGGDGPLISIGQVTVVVQGGGGGEAGGRRVAADFVRGLLDQLARMPGARDQLRRMLA